MCACVRVCVHCASVRLRVCMYACTSVCMYACASVHVCACVCGLKTSPSKASAGVIACNINRITMEEITQHVFILVRMII